MLDRVVFIQDGQTAPGTLAHARHAPLAEQHASQIAQTLVRQSAPAAFGLAIKASLAETVPAVARSNELPNEDIPAIGALSKPINAIRANSTACNSVRNRTNRNPASRTLRIAGKTGPADIQMPYLYVPPLKGLPAEIASRAGNPSPQYAPRQQQPGCKKKAEGKSTGIASENSVHPILVRQPSPQVGRRVLRAPPGNAH